MKNEQKPKRTPLIIIIPFRAAVAMGDGGDGGFDAIVASRRDDAGEAMRASRDLPPGTLLVRVAPFAAVPYPDEMRRSCHGCFRACGAERECGACGVARLCASCAGCETTKAYHAYECHALARLRDGERGLTLAHNDLRLLIRVLSVRRRQRDVVASSYATAASDAAAASGDVIVDDVDAFDALMSGVDGGDDGELPESSIAMLHEVAKQAKFLVAAEARASVDACVRTLGRLQLNGFEMTASASEEEEEGGRGGGGGCGGGGHRPIGVGVYPSAAMFNHDCAPNAAQRFDAFGCVRVETTRRVRKGEELTIPYVDVMLGREERRGKLRKNFAFECACARCEREAG